MDRHSPAVRHFVEPPTEFGPIPFWFWNDDLHEAELLRQLHAFRDAGFGGVLPHARVGLDRRIGYLDDTFFSLMHSVVAEADRLGMKIILYDEASYPSGSACGQVVAQNPDYASQAIGLWEKEITGPHRGFWRPNTGRALLDRHVTTVLGRVLPDGSIDPASLRRLEALPHTVFRLEVGPGRWRAMSVWNTASGGHIRGAHPEQDSGHATAPPAADLLNPDAVAAFIGLTHEGYYRYLAEFFGTTVIAFFTDEPSLFGKGAQRPKEAKPYSPGLLDDLPAAADPLLWLPALWRDFGRRTAAFRQTYQEVVTRRLHRVFYEPLSAWCADHGIALTGHPSASNDMASLRHFQLPGQDMVWRWVLPASPTALEGAHSVAPKAATSGARQHGARRVLTEVCGAYGWQLSLDEVKWLYDWHLVRGNNLINPHAAFYSIRGRRAWESEPDIGLHNVWWPYIHHLNRYAARLSWLLCDGDPICSVAVLGTGTDLPWAAASVLYRHQIDFLYIDADGLAAAEATADGLHLGTQVYTAVIIDGDPPLPDKAARCLDQCRDRGILVHTYRDETGLLAALDRHQGRDLLLRPHSPDLRYIHYRKADLDFYLLVNEGEAAIEGQIEMAVAGTTQVWDAMEGRCRPFDRPSIRLERRQSLVLAVDAQSPPVSAPAPVPREYHRIPLDAAWTVTAADGTPHAPPVPGDWAQHPGLELFSGTLHYRAECNLPEGICGLDLGHVGELAEVFVDGHSIGTRLWAPYLIEAAIPAGRRQLEIHITNSMANAYEGMQRPSGLLGPVELFINSPHPKGRQP